MKFRRRNQNSEPTLDISSLIDVSFLLLVFFLVTSTLQRSEAALKSKLGGIPDPIQHSEPPYEIDIDLAADGSISIDGDPVEPAADTRTLPELQKRLAEINELTRLASTPKLAIIVADDDAEHQRLVDILNALTEARITNITMSGFGIAHP